MGIDPSTYTALVLLFEEPQGVEQVKKILVNHPDKKGYDRLQLIAKSVENIIEEWNPDVVFIEGYAMNAKFNIIQMVEIGTVIRRAIYARHLPCYEIAPTTLKKFITGKGNAKKPDMAAAVEAKYGFTNKSDDIIDAYAVAKMGQTVLSTELVIQGVTSCCWPTIKEMSTKPSLSSQPKKVCAK